MHGAILRVEHREGDLTWSGAAGTLRPDKPCFIASMTKMYVTVVVLRIFDEGRLGINSETPLSLSPFDPIGELLGFWGQSGAFVFHDPQRNLDFAGTVNRLSSCLSCQPSAVSAMIRIMRAVR